MSHPQSVCSVVNIFTIGILLPGTGMPALADFRPELGAGVEHFTWHEYDEGGARLLREYGQRVVLNAKGRYTVPDESYRLVFQGRLYFGSVTYDGATLFSGTAVTSTTDYAGLAIEAAFHYPVARTFDLVGGVGHDGWQRAIYNSSYQGYQIEDYSVVYLRAGLAYDGRPNLLDWAFAVGAKRPVSVNEDAHLQSMGYTRNPTLHPVGMTSLYAEVSYLLSPAWTVVGYYDTYRFAKSAEESVVAADRTSYLVWQPRSSAEMLGIQVRHVF